MLYVTGDTHGEEGRFTYLQSPLEKYLSEKDKLIVCGDFGYLFKGSKSEKEFLEYMSKKPYQILWVDGNHENFDLIDTYPIELWCGGKVHVIQRDEAGTPKIIHLMRGQVFEIEGKKIFTFGGGYSIDKAVRTPHRSWWPQEMPTDEEMKEAIENLQKYNNEVDYIITHTAPEETMYIIHPNHLEEKPLNNFLEDIRKTVTYKHWYMGHLHQDRDLFRSQTVLFFDVRNIETNEIVE